MKPTAQQEFPVELLDLSLQEAVLRQARKHGDCLAVVDPAVRLTFADLLGASASVARRIAGAAADGPRRVALLFDQDAHYLVALLGALRAGCAYAPLDPRRSFEWNAANVAAAECDLVVASDAYMDLARRFGPPALAVDAGDQTGADADFCLPQKPDGLACIYFTSGTTGAPKGVCDTHRNLLHNAMRYANSLLASRADRLSLIQAPIFSGTQSTIFMGLISGAALCSFDVARRGLSGLPGWLIDAGVTMFHSTPAIFRTLAKDRIRYDKVRLIRLEGDRATHQDAAVLRAHFREDCVLVNGLGATECGLIRQYFIDGRTEAPAGNLPLGYAVPGMDVSIVDEAGAEVPAGVAGEVVVASDYLAAGYLNNKPLTDDRFKTNARGRRSYRMGDIGALDADGCLRLSSRTDHRIRINGVAIDGAEIEDALLSLPFVRHGLAAERCDRNDHPMLVAYLVSNGADRPRLERLRDALAERLPPALMPQRVVWLDELPVTLDGKVDRTALPQTGHARPELDERYVRPRNEIEARLVAICQRVLDIEPIGVEDDLFLLGCDSLKIVQVANRIRSELRAELSIPALFEAPNIAAIARAIAEMGEIA